MGTEFFFCGLGSLYKKCKFSYKTYKIITHNIYIRLFAFVLTFSDINIVLLYPYYYSFTIVPAPTTVPFFWVVKIQKKGRPNVVRRFLYKKKDIAQSRFSLPILYLPIIIHIETLLFFFLVVSQNTKKSYSLFKSYFCPPWKSLVENT